MEQPTHVSPSVSVFEALRVYPRASSRVATLGVTPDLYDLRIDEAARVLGVPVERLATAIRGEDRR